eukprot:570956-Pleurochrysis_carterae.AAC.1
MRSGATSGPLADGARGPTGIKIAPSVAPKETSLLRSTNDATTSHVQNWPPLNPLSPTRMRRLCLTLHSVPSSFRTA